MMGLLLDLSGEVNGIMMNLMEKEFANIILEQVLGKTDGDYNDLDEMSESAITEISNIMISSYINAIAHFTNLKIGITVPSLCIDMVGAMLNAPATVLDSVGEKLIFIEQGFKIGDKNIRSNMLLVVDVKSLETIMLNLGLEI